MAKLRVYRTAIGFHDAYVAAPSKKAALKAWGTTKDLFGRGAAETVTDPELIKQPLSSPGEVFKLSRGSTAEQMAALLKEEPEKRHAKVPTMSKVPKPVAPRPDRNALDAAMAALDDATTRQRRELEAVEAEAEQLKKRRRELISAHGRNIAKLEKARAAEERHYLSAMAKTERIS